MEEWGDRSGTDPDSTSACVRGFRWLCRELRKQSILGAGGANCHWTNSSNGPGPAFSALSPCSLHANAQSKKKGCEGSRPMQDNVKGYAKVGGAMSKTASGRDVSNGLRPSLMQWMQALCANGARKVSRASIETMADPQATSGTMMRGFQCFIQRFCRSLAWWRPGTNGHYVGIGYVSLPMSIGE